MCNANREILTKKIRELFPNAEIAEDNEGQVIIYTNTTMEEAHE